MKEKAVRDRIRAARKALKMNQTDFAERLGLKQNSISVLENSDKAAVTDKTIKLICVTFNINEDWLRTGKGEMYGASPHEREFKTIFDKLTPDTQQYLLTMAKGLLKVQQKLLKKEQQ